MNSQGGPSPSTLEELVRLAQDGHAREIDLVVRAIRDGVYGLAIRMLWHPEDAEDATQEILMKVVTRLSTFRGESAFRTWVYRIATNHLLRARQSRVERENLNFDVFSDQLARGLDQPAAHSATTPDQALLEEEVKIGCTHGMLLCLDREHRIAYVLGDVFELRSQDAAHVLMIPPATFRKRLSRARNRLRAFMKTHCGLVNEAAPCRCARRVQPAIAAGRIDPGHLLFARGQNLSRRPLPVLERRNEMEQLHLIAGLFQSHPAFTCPERVMHGVMRLMHSGRFELLKP